MMSTAAMGKRALLLCLAAAIITAGCVGRNIVRPEPESLTLGKTRYEEVTRRFGTPVTSGSVLRDEQTINVIRYAYANPWARVDAVALRAIEFFFLEGVLVGYHYSSSFLKDKTDFDETNVYRFKKGLTTRADVIAMLGEPGGAYIYPMIASRTDTGLVYVYERPKVGAFYKRTMLLKLLVVSLDPTGHVTDVKFGPND